MNAEEQKMWGEVRAYTARGSHNEAFRLIYSLDNCRRVADVEATRAYRYVCESALRAAVLRQEDVDAMHELLHVYASRTGFDEAMARRVEALCKAVQERRIIEAMETAGVLPEVVEFNKDHLLEVMWKIAAISSDMAVDMRCKAAEPGMYVSIGLAFKSARNRLPVLRVISHGHYWHYSSLDADVRLSVASRQQWLIDLDMRHGIIRLPRDHSEPRFNVVRTRALQKKITHVICEHNERFLSKNEEVRR